MLEHGKKHYLYCNGCDAGVPGKCGSKAEYEFKVRARIPSKGKDPWGDTVTCTKQLRFCNDKCRKKWVVRRENSRQSNQDRYKELINSTDDADIREAAKIQHWLRPYAETYWLSPNKLGVGKAEAEDAQIPYEHMYGNVALPNSIMFS